MPVEAVRRELGFVSALGLDHVRIWLSAAGFEQDPAAYLSNLRQVLDYCAALRLGVVLILFDSCGIEEGSTNATWVRIEDIPRLAAGDARLQFVEHIGADRRDIFGKPGLVEVPWRGDPMAAVWEGFVPNPGYDLLGRVHWNRWDRYATAVLDVAGRHEATVLVEIMNEPFVSQLGRDIDRQPIIDFYRHIYELARSLAPDTPLSIGAATVPWFREHEANIGDTLDVVSFHCFADACGLQSTIGAALEVAKGRPVYLSEWGHFPGGDDSEQLSAYEELMPVVLDAGIGWALSHLISGYGAFANAALLLPSGVMRPAGQFVRDRLRSAGAR